MDAFRYTLYTINNLGICRRVDITKLLENVNINIYEKVSVLYHYK